MFLEVLSYNIYALSFWEVINVYAILGAYFCFAFAFLGAKITNKPLNYFLFALILIAIPIVRYYIGELDYLAMFTPFATSKSLAPVLGLIFFAFFVMFDLAVGKKITLFFFTYFIYEVIETLYGTIVYWIMPIGYSHLLKGWELLVFRIVIILTFLLVGRFIKRKVLFSSLKSYWLITLILAFILFWMLFLTFWDIRGLDENRYSVMLAILLLACATVIINVIGIIINVEKRKIDRDKISLQDELLHIQEKYFIGLSEKQYAIRKIKHDLNAHLIAIDRLSQYDDHNKLREYMDELLSHNPASISSEYDTGNRAASIMVNYYADLTKESNILFSYAGGFKDTVKMTEYDINSLFYNLLSNAYEECLRLSEEAGRYIDIKINGHQKAMVLEVSNSCRPESMAAKKPVTSKKNKKGNHGYGMGIIKSIVDKYDGEMKTNCQAGIWETEIIFLDCFE